MLYAKSEPKENPESITEHTNQLLEQKEILNQIYGNILRENKKIKIERVWKLLEYACQYHDVGKVYTPFQNIIREKLKQEKLPTKLNYTYIKHEQLSPLFVPIKELELEEEEKNMLIQAIYYHHERENKELDITILEKIIQEDLLPHFKVIQEEIPYLLTEKLRTSRLKYVYPRIGKRKEEYLDFCMLKGLLHRLDHCASAHITVENEAKKSMLDCVRADMAKKQFVLNELQEFCLSNQEENLIVIGSTGIGKTEGALIWSNNSKLFFTLPLRISINAIYDRILKEIGYSEVGLLHSTALDYMEMEEKETTESSDKIYEESDNLARKVTTCTIDQIFPFAFRYRGYEKIYATLAYSKIVIDEIQAYSPHIVAILLKGIEMISQIGGKFMIMTATLPRIYKEELKRREIEFQEGTFLKRGNDGKSIERHKIALQNKCILEDIEIILERGKTNKVLVIVNTVNRAIELYEQFNSPDVKLLHSRFIQKDRNELEKEILRFSKAEDEHGIWVTTQLVEASLDIDFDYLYTEMSTLDSLFQRMGRCYRKREYKGIEPNVWIYTEEISGVSSSQNSVYDKQIVEKSIQFLEENNEKVLKEEEKVFLVDQLYSKEELEGTHFLSEFKASMEVLDNLDCANMKKEEAQKILRNIQNVTVMPWEIYEENKALIEQYENTKDLKARNQIKRELMKLTTSITIGQWKHIHAYSLVLSEKITDIYKIDLPYSKEKGMLLKQDIEYELNRRIMD